MSKPQTADGYDNEVTENCERILVTLISGLGPWRDSIYLVGGLTPRYLVNQKPPQIPAHAGTGDVDVVVQLQMLNNTEAYHSLEENLKTIGFQRGQGKGGKPVAWRWVTSINGTTIVLEFLADDPAESGGRVVELPTKGNVSAMNIPHSAMVFDHHKIREVKAELLGDNGIATVDLRFADLVTFTCLKVFAVEDRNEPKDAHDLVYCLTHYDGGVEAAAKEFTAAKQGKHKDAIEKALRLLERHFADDGETDGYKKSGPVAVAKFEIGSGEEEEEREARNLRQREVCDLVTRFLQAVA